MIMILVAVSITQFFFFYETGIDVDVLAKGTTGFTGKFCNA